MSDYKLGWHLYCIGAEFSECSNEAQRNGYCAAFVQGEQ